jgi:hypothetical protein
LGLADGLARVQGHRPQSCTPNQFRTKTHQNV